MVYSIGSGRGSHSARGVGTEKYVVRRVAEIGQSGDEEREDNRPAWKHESFLSIDLWRLSRSVDVAMTLPSSNLKSNLTTARPQRQLRATTITTGPTCSRLYSTAS